MLERISGAGVPVVMGIRGNAATHGAIAATAAFVDALTSGRTIREAQTEAQSILSRAPTLTGDIDARIEVIVGPGIDIDANLDDNGIADYYQYGPGDARVESPEADTLADASRDAPPLGTQDATPASQGPANE